MLFWVAGAVWFLGNVPSPVDDGQHAVFNAWLFSADTLLPIINLGQDGFWRLDGASQWIGSSGCGPNTQKSFLNADHHSNGLSRAGKL